MNHSKPNQNVINRRFKDRVLRVIDQSVSTNINNSAQKKTKGVN